MFIVHRTSVGLLNIPVVSEKTVVYGAGLLWLRVA